MNVTLLRQTRKNNCGQTAMAMFLGKSIRDVEKLYGNISSTYPYQHISVLSRVGFNATMRYYKDFSAVEKLPDVALVRLATLKRSSGHLSVNGKTKRSGHMVLWANGMFYDPNGTTYDIHHLPNNMIIDIVFTVTPKNPLLLSATL